MPSQTGYARGVMPSRASCCSSARPSAFSGLIASQTLPNSADMTATPTQTSIQNSTVAGFA